MANAQNTPLKASIVKGVSTFCCSVDQLAKSISRKKKLNSDPFFCP